MKAFDTVIVGGGIAGASAGHVLASGDRSVLLLEQETHPGYHTTGRSAAVYTQAYGNAVIRGLTLAGADFFHDPPKGFANQGLVTARGVMFTGDASQVEQLDCAAEQAQRFVPSVRRLSAAEARQKVPILREDYVAGAVLEPEARDIDVNALHQGFLRGLRAEGGQVICHAEVTSLERLRGGWQVVTKDASYWAPVVVNAAGAWADHLADLAEARPVGLVPKRRTVIQFDPPVDADPAEWPVVIGVEEDFYFKPDAGKLIGSPADETPSQPCDARPEELDIAIAVDRIERATLAKIQRISHSWAGLRSFVADKSPVVGFDPDQEGFFWLAGQGGYGIQTSPALGRVVAALLEGADIPTDIADLGVTSRSLSPARFREAPATDTPA